MGWKHAVAAGLLLNAAAAQAALIDVDTGFGAATGIVDTSTGLEWLKVSATAGLTPDDVFAQMAPGGRLDGYRYATAGELTCGLLPSQMPASRCSFSWSTRDVAPVFAFLDRFGSRIDQVVLFQAEAPGGPNIPMTDGESFQLQTFSDGVQSILFDAQQVPLPVRPSNHWLVREIPEPSAVALLGLGLVALAGAAMRTRPAVRRLG